MIFVNGDIYEGYWKNDKAHGKGEFKSITGIITKGTWFENKLEGYGEECCP